MATTFWTALATFLAGTTALSTGFQRIESPNLRRADDYEWTALGDSYASGVGAGKMDDGSQRCMRFDEAYPRLMNGDARLPGGSDRIFNNVVCSGAKTADVDAQQFYDAWHNPSVTDKEQVMFGPRPPFGKPQIATISIGGNDIDLKGLVMNCLFEFLPTRSCDSQQRITRGILDSPDLPNNIAATIKKIMDKGQSGPAGANFKLFVTGYGRLFNSETTQCNDITFAWWGNFWPSFGYKLTQERRRTFNGFADDLNKAVEKAVSMSGDSVIFVPWDDALDADGGHHYCESFATEPDHNNPNIWFWQNMDRSDKELVDVEGPFFDALARKVDPSVEDWDGLRAKYGPKTGDVFTEANFQSPNVTADQVFDFMYDITIESGNLVDTGFWQLLAGIFRVVHPKPPLHAQIASRILDKIGGVGGTHKPMDDRKATCDGNTFLLPNTWGLSDGAHTKTDLLYRMRDQACQGLCQDIQGVDPKYMAAKKDGIGCEYTIKIHAYREMWLYVSESGQNCYDATARIDDQCKGNSQGGWINGPNAYEFYQFGVRNINDPTAKHDMFSDFSHLPYNQMWCGVRTSGLTDRYDIKTSHFDDGDWGKTIQRNVHSNCGGIGAANQWVYEPDAATYNFDGGQQSDHYGSFRSPWDQRGCTADTMAVALGLPKGMVSCDE